MTQPPEGPPPYGYGYGAPPPGWTPPPADRGARTADQILSWILWTLTLMASLVLGFIAVFLAFAQDGCGVNDTGVCDSDDFFGELMIYWGVLFVAAVGAMIGMIVASVKDTFLWPWSVGGAATCAIATFVFYGISTS